MRKKIFLVISEEDIICPECGSPLCRRDRRLRVHKEAGGKKSWFAINRLKGTNVKCQRLHNELPDCMISYKHYDPDIIEDVVDQPKWSKHRRTDEIVGEAIQLKQEVPKKSVRQRNSRPVFGAAWWTLRLYMQRAISATPSKTDRKSGHKAQKELPTTMMAVRRSFACFL